MKCPKAPTIILARGDVLGDVIVTTALIAPLKKQFPDAKIVYMIRKEFFPLLEDHPDIDHCIEDPLPYSMKKEHQPLFWHVLKRLKAEKADIFIGLWEEPRYAILSALARIKIRLGHATSLTNRLGYTHTVSSDSLDFLPHKCDINAKLLQLLGIQNANTYPVDLRTNPEELSRLKKEYPWMNAPYTVMHIDAGTPQRILFPHHLSAIEALLQKESTGNIVLVGRALNAEAAAFIIENSTESSRVINLTEGLSLSDLKYIISACDLLIGSDSGPAHIASGFRKPVIIHYVNRIQNAMHWGPWMTPQHIITSKHTCIDACRPDTCTKPDCRETLSMSAYALAIHESLYPKQDDSTERNQRFYWLEKTLNILCLGPCATEINLDLLSQGYRSQVAPKTWSISALVTVMNAQNTNLILLSGKVSLFTRVKVDIARRWVANKIHFFPKIRKANQGFEANQVLAQLGVEA
jgi:ADP-heptose:LPS heptosyltransferase